MKNLNSISGAKIWPVLLIKDFRPISSINVIEHRNSLFSTRMPTSPSPSLPSHTRQTIFGLTGALAGGCSLPIEFLWQRLGTSQQPSLRFLLQTSATPVVYRAAVRFWVFDLTKQQISTQSLPAWFKGGLSGAAGGFAEICTQSLIHRRLPPTLNLINHSSKLFVCFGSYTYLSTTLSPNHQPPKPFWYCWLMGAAAGALGSGFVSAAEGLRGKMLWRTAVPKGALTIGTVIAVQVTSCASILQQFED